MTITLKLINIFNTFNKKIEHIFALLRKEKQFSDKIETLLKQSPYKIDVTQYSKN